jgi:molecular chaperone DnaK (HSP70)
MVPSAIHFIENPGALDRLGSWPPLARRFFIGRRALIGRQALERNEGVVHPSFVPTFKPGLSGEALRPLARVGRESLTARDAAHAFLRELLREIKRESGHRVRDLVVTSPVMAFETYRAEVQRAAPTRRAPGPRFVGKGLTLSSWYNRVQSRRADEN